MASSSSSQLRPALLALGCCGAVLGSCLASTPGASAGFDTSNPCQEQCKVTDIMIPLFGDTGPTGNSSFPQSGEDAGDEKDRAHARCLRVCEVFKRRSYSDATAVFFEHAEFGGEWLAVFGTGAVENIADLRVSDANGMLAGGTGMWMSSTQNMSFVGKISSVSIRRPGCKVEVFRNPRGTPNGGVWTSGNPHMGYASSTNRLPDGSENVAGNDGVGAFEVSCAGNTVTLSSAQYNVQPLPDLGVASTFTVSWDKRQAGAYVTVMVDGPAGMQTATLNDGIATVSLYGTRLLLSRSGDGLGPVSVRYSY